MRFASLREHRSFAVVSASCLVLGGAIASRATTTIDDASPGRVAVVHSQPEGGKLLLRSAGDTSPKRVLIKPIGRHGTKQRRVTLRRSLPVPAIHVGRYRIIAPDVEHAGIPITPQPQRQTVTIRAGRTAAVTFRYPRALVDLSSAGSSVTSHDAGCVVDDRGTAWCWQHGRQAKRVRGAPPLVEIVAGAPDNFSFSCALARRRRIWCWRIGGSAFALPRSKEPIRKLVATRPGDWAPVCGLDGEGRLWCWSLPSDGAAAVVGPQRTLPGKPLRDAAMSSDGSTPVLCAVVKGSAMSRCYALEQDWGPHVSTWAASLIGNVPGKAPSRIVGSTVGDLTGGASFCGLTQKGAASCWTASISGEPIPPPRRIRRAPKFIDLAVGDDFGTVSGCGLTRSETAWCWQLNGAFTPVPRRVPGDFRSLSIHATEGQQGLCGLTGSSDVRCGDGQTMALLPAPWQKGER